MPSPGWDGGEDDVDDGARRAREATEAVTSAAVVLTGWAKDTARDNAVDHAVAVKMMSAAASEA